VCTWRGVRQLRLRRAARHAPAGGETLRLRTKAATCPMRAPKAKTCVASVSFGSRRRRNPLSPRHRGAPARRRAQAYHRHSRSTRPTACVFRPRHTLQDSRRLRALPGHVPERCGTSEGRLAMSSRWHGHMRSSNGSRPRGGAQAATSIGEPPLCQTYAFCLADGRLDECLAVLIRARKASASAHLPGSAAHART